MLISGIRSMGVFESSGMGTAPDFGVLAQLGGSGIWLDQLLLIVMVGLAVFAVCRSTRRQ